jgi:hypothetical protein
MSQSYENARSRRGEGPAASDLDDGIKVLEGHFVAGDTEIEDRDWDLLVANLRNGHCTPFLGAGTSFSRVPLGAGLARAWATEHGYPFQEVTDLAKVMQYVGMTKFHGDLISLKEFVVQKFLRGVAPPDFTDPGQIHAVLARCDLPVYVTTTYDDFMTLALRHRRKEPVVGVSPWYGPASASWHDPTAPTSARPLVYHLHGHYEHPESLVLSEDDHIEFLIRLGSEGRSPKRGGLVPPAVYKALRNEPLLFLGYSLRDWSFLVLFRTLLRDIPESHRRRHVIVQLAPDPPMGESAKNYLEEYFRERHITVFWKSTDSFTAELARRMWGQAR